MLMCCCEAQLIHSPIILTTYPVKGCGSGYTVDRSRVYLKAAEAQMIIFF